MRLVSRIFALMFALGATACLDDSRDRSKQGADGEAGAEVQWQEVFVNLPGALISVWGSRSTDVWAVGSDTHDGWGPLVLHYDGQTWARRRATPSGDFWWAHGFSAGPVFLAGSSGRIFRYDAGGFARVPSPATTGIVYGVWGVTAEDLWAVGGDPESGSPAFVWRLQAGKFTPVDGLPLQAGAVSSYFKVWGRSANDVWIVGSPGVVIHYDGVTFRQETVPVQDPLFTVHATASGRAAIVGGADLGTLLERQGNAWQEAVLARGTRALFGVFMTDSAGYAVGDQRTVLVRDEGGWTSEATGFPGEEALHAVWVDDVGGAWAVGGHVQVPPLGVGLLLHKGERIGATIVPQQEPVEGGSGDGDAQLDVAVDAPNPVMCTATTPDAAIGFVTCGAATCDLGASKCCADQSSGAPVGCVAIATACPSGQAPVTCDDPEDCGSGWSCCLNRYLQSGVLVNIQCEQGACIGPRACATCADCASGACAPSASMPAWSTCSLP